VKGFSEADVSVSIATDKSGNKASLAKSHVHLERNLLVYDLSFRLPVADGLGGAAPNRAASNIYDQNYRLCRTLPQTDENAKKGDQCFKFSLYRPFFQLNPHGADLKPFVFLESERVAIFAVVDPEVAEQVGILNFSWLNSDKNFQTVVSIEEPGEALKQQIERFEVWYRDAHENRSFSGVKILLAQMSPERARVFAARFQDFQIVVTGADKEQSTVTSGSHQISTRTQTGGYCQLNFWKRPNHQLRKNKPPLMIGPD
jgi:hypothetical protein